MTLVPELFVRRLNKPKGLPINVRDVSVTGDGQTDDYAALNEAVRSAGATGTLYFPAGTYVVGTNLTIPACCIFAFGAKLKPSSGVTVTLSGPVETAPGESIIATGTAGTVSITGTLESSGGVLDVRAFGAKGDGVTDDTAAIQAAADAARAAGLALWIPRGGTYLLNSTLNLRFIQLIATDATFSVNHADIGILLGGDASSSNNPTQELGEALRVGGITATPTIRIIGAKGQHLHIARTDYLQVYSDTEPAVYDTDYSTGYSSFWIKRCNTLELTNNLTTTGSSVQWINENKFWLDRIDNFYCRGTYGHNRNQFFGGSFENGASGGAVHFEVGRDNVFHAIRHEGSSGAVEFGAGTWANEVAFGYRSNQRVGIRDVREAFTVTDLGWRNVVRWADDAGWRRVPLLSINPATCRVYSNETGSGLNVTSLARVNMQRLGIDTIHRSNNQIIWESAVLPVQGGDVVMLEADSANVRWRVSFYDVNGALITTEPTADVFKSANLAWNDTDYDYRPSNNVSNASVQVRDGNVKYLKVQVRAGSASSGVPIRFIGVDFVTTYTRSWAYAALGQSSQSPAVSAVPTIGYAAVGEVVNNLNGGQFSCAFALDTTLGAGASAGATSLTATSATGVQDGDVVGVLLDDGSTHWTAVGNLSGATFDVNALPSAAASGNRLVFNRWAGGATQLADNANTRTQFVSVVKTNVSSGVAQSVFTVSKRTTGTGSSNRTTFAGTIQVAVSARTAGGALRNRVASVPFGLAVAGSGDITLVQGTQLDLSIFNSGTLDYTIALSLSGATNTSATLQVTVTQTAGTLENNEVAVLLQGITASTAIGQRFTIAAV